MLINTHTFEGAFIQDLQDRPTMDSIALELFHLEMLVYPFSLHLCEITKETFLKIVSVSFSVIFYEKAFIFCCSNKKLLYLCALSTFKRCLVHKMCDEKKNNSMLAHIATTLQAHIVI